MRPSGLRLESDHVRSFPVGVDQAQEGAPPTPSAASSGASWPRRSSSPRATAAATPTPTSASATPSTTPRPSACPRTTSSGRSSAAPANSTAATSRKSSTRATAPAAWPSSARSLTDNRNRTGAEIRQVFEPHDGNLGEPGCVAWMFEKRGVFLVDGDRYDEDDLMDGDRRRRRGRAPRTATYSGADRHRRPRGGPRGARRRRGRDRVGRRGHGPEEHGRGRRSEAKSLLHLIEALEDHDDVDAVHANFDIPEESGARLEAAA